MRRLFLSYPWLGNEPLQPTRSTKLFHVWIIVAIRWVACKWTMAANSHHLMKIYPTWDRKSATCSKDFWKWIHKRTATSCFNLLPFDCSHQTVGLQMDKNLMEKAGRKKKTNPNLLWLPISTLKVKFRTEHHSFCQNIATVGRPKAT